MVNVRVERSAGYAGIAFVFVTLLAALLPGLPPAPSASVQDVGAYLDSHHVQWLIAVWLALPGSAFYFWFLVQLRAYLRTVPGQDDGLPTYMLVSGVALGTIALFVAVIQAVLGFHPSGELSPAMLRVLWDLFNGGGAIIFMPATAALFAAAHSGNRHRSLPSYAVWWGYIAAVCCAGASFSIFFRTGLERSGLGSFTFGLIPLAIWVVMASLVLIRLPHTEG